MQSERAELISQIKSLRGDSRQFQNIVDEKIKEIEPLQQALGKLRNTNNAGRGGLCSSEEELNSIVCYESEFLLVEFINFVLVSQHAFSITHYSCVVDGCRYIVCSTAYSMRAFH